MDTDEAGDLVAELARSLEEHPDQFYYVVSVTSIGFQAGGSGPDSGTYVASPTIQAPTESVIGFQANMGGAQIEIAHNMGERAGTQHLSEMVAKLHEIADEFRGLTPDKGRLQRVLDWLKSRAAPDLIVAIVGSYIARAL